MPKRKQLSLLEALKNLEAGPGESADEIYAEVEQATIDQVVSEIPHKFAPGDVVAVANLTTDAPMFYGSVVGYNPVGYVLVNIGAGEPYACSEDRLTRYDGVVSLWRLGQAVICDRPDCQPHQSARPFTCQQCEARSTAHWWYVGEMSTEPRAPRWPDAVWFPNNYDPNTRSFE